MVGLLIVTHGELGAELVRTTETIAGKLESCEFMTVERDEPVEELKNRILKGLKRVNSGSGVIILADMFGGTPSNLAISLTGRADVELVTGVNLPVMIKLASLRDKMGLRELAREVVDYGRRSICLPSEILNQGDE